jgi:hypothetical protein
VPESEVGILPGMPAPSMFLDSMHVAPDVLAGWVGTLERITVYREAGNGGHRPRGWLEAPDTTDPVRELAKVLDGIRSREIRPRATPMELTEVPTKLRLRIKHCTPTGNTDKDAVRGRVAEHLGSECASVNRFRRGR